jgi:hypothetical protein
MPGFLDRILGRKSDGFTIDDPRPIRQEAPYTFDLPDPADLAAVQPGDLVKAIFRPDPPDRSYGAERMWVKVIAIEGGAFVGTLDNEPCVVTQVKLGDRVTVPATHVIDIYWGPNHFEPAIPRQRRYWDRCFVDDCVLSGASHVDYLYRETPEPMRESDKDPDSGWRIRGTPEAITADECAGKGLRYVALGAVLNRDDRWLNLINEPAGSAFQWDEQLGEYVRERG